MKYLVYALWIATILVVLLRADELKESGPKLPALPCIYQADYLAMETDSSYTLYRIHHFGDHFDRFLAYGYRAGRDSEGRVYFKTFPDMLEYLGIPEICDDLGIDTDSL